MSSTSRLATDPAYLAHAIAALRVVTHAEPLEYMDKFPYPGATSSRARAMSVESAAWVREFVWTKRMRKAFGDTPGAYLRCPCQYGPSGHCNAGKHTKCWHSGNEPHASPEAYVCGPDGTQVLTFTEDFTHPTGSATGAKRTSHAQVWLADRACRWRCPCDCHTSMAPAPEPPPAAPGPQIDKPVQLDLFASLTA